jgi:hypothetical protein
MNQVNQISEHENVRADAFEHNLESFGWGAILLLTGSMWLVPKGLIPDGSWLMSVGFILLGLNAARYSFRKELNICSLSLGVLALLAGVGAFFHVNLPLLGIALIVIGVIALLLQLNGHASRAAEDPCRNFCER